MNIGLFFGSFNPIHNGHLIIANMILQKTNLKQIWFVVSPQSPFKKAKNLLKEHDRLFLVKLAMKSTLNTSLHLSWEAIIFLLFINGKMLI